MEREHFLDGALGELMQETYTISWGPMQRAHLCFGKSVSGESVGQHEIPKGGGA